MESSTDSLPARVTVVCPQCGRKITTGQSGNSTRCPKSRGGCGTSVYIPAGTTRPPVSVMCQHCRSFWDTRAKAGNMVRCPNCKAPRRVPAAVRREAVYAPAPEPYRTRETRPRRPAAPPTPRADPDRSRWTPPRPPVAPRRPAPGAATGPTLAAILRGLTPAARPPAPAPLDRPADPGPAPYPRSAAPFRPAPPTRTAAARPGRINAVPPQTFRDHHRRDSVGQLVTSMGGALRLAYDAPHGMCEVMDVTQPRDLQRCRGVASRGVVFWSQLSQEVTAYACPAHAVALAAETQRHPAITATVVGLNV